MDEKAALTVQEAGHRGGRVVKEKYGREFYTRVGRKRGAAVAAQRGPAFYAEIGRRGGNAVKARYEAESYHDIRWKGGVAVKAHHGPDYYAHIGRKGAAGRRPKQAEQA